MDDSGNLSATLTNEPETTGGGLSSSISAPTPEPTSNAPADNTLTPPSDNLTALQPMIQAAGQASAQDMPRMSRLKASLAGFLLSGVPGAVAGAIEPKMIQSEVAGRKQMQQSQITFASAHAAHEVAMAHQADAEYQALPAKLQDEAAARGLANIDAARKAGYLPVASIPLDQGNVQNSQNAMTALNSVKSQFGAVPSGLLYIHTGSGMTVMKLQDPNAALDTINLTRRARGLQPLDSDTFGALSAPDKEAMAREAINFADPRDVNGMVTQTSLNLANMRLQTVKAQPDFNGKDALVTQLQNTVDNQKSVLDSGAGAEAIRKGAAAGAEAQAEQPGKTAAEVENINATAGPEAKAAGEKAGAVARAQLPTELALEKAKQGANPVYAYDPQQKATILTTKGDATDRGLSAVRNVTQPEIEKDQQMARQLGDAQMNVSAYRNSSREMGELSATDKSRIASMMSEPKLRVGIFGTELPTNWISTLSDSSYWKQLSPAAQDAMVGYIGARGSIIAYAKAISGSGRLTESQLQTELKNLPDPTVPTDVREKQFDRFQRNIDQAASGIPRIPGIDLPSDIRARIETPPKPAPPKPQGKFTAKNPVKVGQNVQVPHVPGLSRVKKVYDDGSFDADQKP